MGVTQESSYGSASIWRTSEVSMDGIVSDSREMLHVGRGSVEARLASATAYSLFDRGIFSNTMDPKRTIILWTKAKYLVILSSFVSMPRLLAKPRVGSHCILLHMSPRDLELDVNLLEKLRILLHCLMSGMRIEPFAKFWYHLVI